MQRACCLPAWQRGLGPGRHRSRSSGRAADARQSAPAASRAGSFPLCRSCPATKSAPILHELFGEHEFFRVKAYRRLSTIAWLFGNNVLLVSSEHEKMRPLQITSRRCALDHFGKF